MSKITLESLGRRLLEKRGERGVRDVAREIGISHSTLSRVERGYLPDLETFSKICKWLKINPGDVLGKPAVSKSPRTTVSVHFRKDQTLAPRTAQALAQMILAAQRALVAMDEDE